MEQVTDAHVHLEVENIGGIDRTDVEFGPGVTVLTGRNATNRTSLLQAVMAALGSERVSLKGDAETGSVSLRVGSDTYTRTLERTGEAVTFDGEPYLDDPELADLFAFLLESNEARRAVVTNADLRDIVMRPVDADEIRADIRRLRSEKSELQEQIEDRETLGEKLPGLEQQRRTVERDIETKQAELAEKRDALDELSEEPSTGSGSTLEAKMETLREKREALDEVEFRLESQRDSLESLQDEREELEERAGTVEDDGSTSLDEIRSELGRVRERKQRLDAELGDLQHVIQFNEEMLEGTHEDIAAALRDDETDVTDRLLDDSRTVVCWTCGAERGRERIEGVLETLRSLRRSKYAEYQELEDDLATLKERRSTIESRRQKRQTIESKLETVGEEIDERETKIDELETRRGRLVDAVDELEEAVDELEQEDHSERLAVHREVNELEVELARLEAERDRIEENIETVEDRVDELEGLEEQRAGIQTELQERRTRIERIETEAVEQFNDHMATVLDLLDYANLDRVWIERLARDVGGSDHSAGAEFRLHVVRQTADGVTYEDEFEHLSESEREVTGLVFALAGYLAHDVHEVVPFMLLDSLEAIDSERIATLVEYFSGSAAYLVTALLPEDADALGDECEQITDI